MNKRKAFEKYNDLMARVGRGGYWINQIDGFIPIFQMAQEYTYLQVPIWAFAEWVKSKYGWELGITFVHILVFVIIKHYLKTYIIPYFLGKFDEKWGLWKYTNEFNAKKEHLAPWNVEATKTMNNIAEKVGAKSEFKEL